MLRCALVTGAAQGMGRAIALRLARDGLDVAVNDIKANSIELINTEKEIEKLGRKSTSIIADVSNEKEVESMMQDVSKYLGSLDVMVANAGIFEGKPLVELSGDEWDKLLSINLRGVFLCYREAAKIMIKQGKGGRLIAASSSAGYTGGPNICAYATSKWGVRGLTQNAAIELAPYKITVNAYCPGSVDTPLLNRALEYLAANENTTVENVKNSFVQNTPLKRLAAPDEIANFVSFVASHESEYMTGQSVLIDGGLTSV